MTIEVELFVQFSTRTRTIFGHRIRHFYPQTSKLIVLFLLSPKPGLFASRATRAARRRRLIRGRRDRVDRRFSIPIFPFVFSVFQPVNRTRHVNTLTRCTV